MNEELLEEFADKVFRQWQKENPTATTINARSLILAGIEAGIVAERMRCSMIAIRRLEEAKTDEETTACIEIGIMIGGTKQ